MRTGENRVKFGLNNVVIAPETDTDVYGEVFSLPGAVNLSIEPNGEENSFYADNQIYYQTVANQGYTGTLEIARIIEEFEEKILGIEKEEETGIHIEKRDAKTTRFAMGFAIDGDVKNTYFWMYGITATRPSSEASTTNETAEPQTDTLNITVAGLNNGTVRIKTTSETPDTVKDKWFDKVRLPGEGLGE